MLLGQSIPSALAVRRNARTSCSGAGGSVRSTPTFPSIISFAAANPVSSDSWAFQFSTGSIARYSRRSRSPSRSISCAGIGSETPPRSASFAIRSLPTTSSRASVEPAGAWPSSRCTPT